MTLLTHLAFRRFHKRHAKPYLQLGPGGPWVSLAGVTAILAVMVSTWWVPGFRITLLAGVPWLAVLTAGYWLWSRTKQRNSPAGS
jgi:AAT family amino acid transporter